MTAARPRPDGARPRREPLRPLRLFGLFFRIGALNELQYRANLAVQLFQSGLALATGLAVLGLVFGQTDNLGGWSRPELLAVMGVHILMGGIINTAIQPNMERLMTDIREGTLDFVLTKPEDAQVLISVREFRIWQAVDVVVGGIVWARR
jgi:ABC-2 type transport system permease protein